MAKNVEIPGGDALEPDRHRHAGQSRHALSLRRFFPTIVLISATLFFAYDIVVDLMDDSEEFLHIFIEFFVFLSISIVLWGELRRISALKSEVLQAHSRMARLSGELLAVMRSQFAGWGLSPSESEIALLLIKGLSMKEIAQARQVKEKTIRQQATSVYAKSGCAGRHELAARFIEDLIGDGVTAS